jgi:hypothetical protein
VLYRLPAVIHSWGWVNTDGAYGAFVALRLLAGDRPAPVFTEGANYQGTLKGHLAALFAVLTGHEDLSRLLVLASLVLSLVFLAAAMSLARRIAGTGAAWATGLYLAFGPKFLTTFLLNSVGQYADVLALGTLALALLFATIEGPPRESDRRRLLGVGFLLGAAFWQQPVALSFAVTAAVCLVLWRPEGRPWRLWALAGLAIGVLPVFVWNVKHDWASGDILGRDPGALAAQARALPALVEQTTTLSFPVLAGVSRGHPWWGPALRAFGLLLLPAALVASLAVTRRALVASVRERKASAALVPPLLFLFALVQFWAVAAGAVYLRPRYLLPLMAATAIQLGVVVAALGRRSRPAAVALLGAILATNVAGMADRLGQGAATAEYYGQVIRSLERKGVRTAYADFSLSAPITMITRERILVSSRLGPTPAYEAEAVTARVAAEGPDAYVLRPDDDPEAFAAVLRRLGVTYRMDVDPVPVFHSFSRLVRLEEVAGFRGAETAPPPEPEE